MARRSTFHVVRSVVFFSLIALIAPLSFAQQTGWRSEGDGPDGRPAGSDRSALLVAAAPSDTTLDNVTTIAALQPGPDT